MLRLSNSLLGILNFVTFLLSITLIASGVMLSRQGTSDCQKVSNTPGIVLGVFLLLVSLAGFIGACCRVTWLLGIYLFTMFLLFLFLFVYTIFIFAVTNKGAGKVLSNRGYKEYRLGDYSNWLQNQVNSDKNWNPIRSCLVSKVCSEFNEKFSRDTIKQFYQENLSSIQSGCCKPADECNFTYIGPTHWLKSTNSTSPNPDCALWDNNPETLCFNCDACKGGVLDRVKWIFKIAAVIYIVILVFLIIVFSIGCCAFRNNREENHNPRGI